MKRRIACWILTAALLAAFAATTASAAHTAGFGELRITDVYSDTVSVVVLDAAGQEIAANEAGCYPVAAKLRLQYRGAVSGAKYVLFLQNADAAPSEENLLYIDQQTATAAGVTFTAAPQSTLPEGAYYLAISGNGGSGITAKTTVASFQSYGAFRRGDVNEDGEINGKDVTTLRRFLAGGYGVVIENESVADVNKDGVVNGKDITILRRYLAGGYGVTLD